MRRLVPRTTEVTSLSPPVHRAQHFSLDWELFKFVGLVGLVLLVLCIINNFTITGMVSILAVPCGTWRIRCPFRLSNDGRWRRGLPLVTRHRRWSSDHAWC